MYGSLDISVSGMIAQRTRINTIAANIANRNTVMDAQGNPEPYRRRFAEFAAGDPSASTRTGREMGVHVRRVGVDDGEPRKVWDPSSPLAKPDGHPDAGYVYYPNVDPTTETINGMEAQRAYEANVAAAEASKTMLAQALRLIA